MKDKSLTFASIVAAGVASLCCIGPLAAVGLGLGSFGAAQFFEGLRPYLLGTTGLLLAGAFYFAYRKQPVAECADGSCAVSPAAKRKQKMLLWLSAGCVAALAAFPHYAGVLWGDVTSADATALAASRSDGESIAVFSVEGMTCAGCAVGMKATLEREEGVARAEVDYERAIAQVHFDSEKTTVERLIAAIGELGYSAKFKEPPS